MKIIMILTFLNFLGIMLVSGILGHILGVLRDKTTSTSSGEPKEAHGQSLRGHEE